jgi:protein TonB
MEAVTSVLLERARHDGGLPRMVTASLVGHVALLAVLAAGSAIGLRSREPDLREVMTISLGGAPGPNAGGMNMMASPAPPRAQAPAEPVKRPSPVVPPPAAAKPAMTLPLAAKPAKAPPKPLKAGPADAAQRAPTATPAPAAAAPGGDAFNANRGMGFGGLSTGGGMGSGSYLDVKNFCCPDYLMTMIQVIRGNWSARQQVAGETMVGFRIQRDGRLTDIEVERSSGYPALDLTAQRALFVTQRLPPLPAAFPDDHLTVHLKFEYIR